MLSFAVGCVQAVDVPGRQMFMVDLVGDAELRRGTSLYAAVTGLAKIAGPAVAGIIFRLLLDLPRGIEVAAGMALLIGGFGIQFEVTNPLMATRVFHLGSLGFGLLGTTRGRQDHSHGSLARSRI